MIYDYEVADVPYFTWRNWTRVTCLHCDRYTCISPDREAAMWDFLQHFQAVHRK